MADLFSSGVVVDLILVVMAIELGVMACLRRRLPRRVDILEVVLALLPGVLLLLALRAALLQMPWGWVALFLALALPPHLADAAQR